MLIEYGSGASAKTRLILDAAPQLAAYAPIDISVDALEPPRQSIRRDYPDLIVEPLARDFTQRWRCAAGVAARPSCGFFPGLDHRQLRPGRGHAPAAEAQDGDGQWRPVILGADLVKDLGAAGGLR